MVARRLRIRQLTLLERSLIDDVVRKEKGSATDALRRVNAVRKEQRIRPIGKTAVHRYVKGECHRLGAIERRGRQ